MRPDNADDRQRHRRGRSRHALAPRQHRVDSDRDVRLEQLRVERRVGTGMAVFLAGGGSNGLVVSANDGATWSGSALTGQSWQALWGLSATDVYAVGDNGSFAHYTGVWTQLAAVPGGKNLHGVWGSSDTDLFAVGAAGTIMHFNGTTWSAQASGLNEHAQRVWGTASNDVFAVGGAGTILHYDGTKWLRQVSNTGEDLYTVGGVSHADVFVGGRGTLLHWGGFNWSPMSPAFGDVFGMWIARGDSLLVGNVTVTSGLDAAGLLFVRTPLPTSEVFCGDPWTTTATARSIAPTATAPRSACASPAARAVRRRRSRAAT